MTVYELAQKIPNNDPNKELLLLIHSWTEAQKLKAEVEELRPEIDSKED